jgi:hypothetical protein
MYLHMNGHNQPLYMFISCTMCKDHIRIELITYLHDALLYVVEDKIIGFLSPQMLLYLGINDEESA